METNQLRLDDGEVIFFKQELTKIDARIYMNKLPLLKGKTLVPKIMDVDETDESYLYRQYKTTGKAKIIGPGATDLPSVNVEGKEYTARIKFLGEQYEYTIMEIKAAAKKNKPLSDLFARAARRAIEELIDFLIAFGDADHDIKGFVNQDSVVDATTFVPVTKNATGDTEWLSGGAPAATGLEMIADVNNFVAQVWNQLKEAEGIGSKVVVVLPAPEYAYLASAPVGDNADKTALNFLTANNPFIEEIIPWHKLTGAGTGGANRMVCYVRDPEVLGSLVPMEYSPQQPQLDGIKYIVPVLASCGGTVIRYPVAMAYGDGI